MCRDKIAETIAKLPDLIQPLAGIYGDAALRWTDEQLELWVRGAFDRGWRKSLEALENVMTLDELESEANLQNAILRDLNGNNAAFVRAQKNAIIELLITVGLAAIAKL